MRHHSKSFNWNQKNSRTIILTKILPFWDLKLAIYVHIGKSIYFNSLLGVQSKVIISDLCCKISFDTKNIQTLVYNLTTRWRLSWVVSYVEWQALNEVNDLEFWKKNPEIQSLLALNKSFETLNKTSHRCRFRLNFNTFYTSAKCLLTQEYFYIKKSF